MSKGLIIIIPIFFSCQNSSVDLSNCNQIAGFYSGLLKMGYVEGNASINISNDCNFTYTQELKGYDMTSQSGNIIYKNSMYVYKWDDNSDSTLVVTLLNWYWKIIQLF